MRPLHIVAIVFAIVMIAITLRNYFKKKSEFMNMVLWSVVWIGLIIATLLFDALKVYTESLNVRAFDLIVIIALIASFIFHFQMNTKLQQLGTKMEEIVQHIAMQESKKKK